MIWCILILLFIVIVFMFLDPYIDYYKDSKKKLHIVIWYDSFYGVRKYFNLIGGQN